ncbi:MAG: hypothetical protein QW343_01730 [Candidatus Norongarragalinales archaeon]
MAELKTGFGGTRTLTAGFTARRKTARLGKAVLAKCGDAAFLKRFERELRRNARKQVEYSKKFVACKHLKNEEIAALLEEYGRLVSETYSCGVLPNLLDYASDDANNILLAKLEEYLRGRTKNLSSVNQKRIIILRE